MTSVFSGKQARSNYTPARTNTPGASSSERTDVDAARKQKRRRGATSSILATKRDRESGGSLSLPALTRLGG